MAEAGVERRLTTVLAADVVGYSRLMAADDSGTLAQLKTHRKEVLEPKTAEYHGRVVKLMGDGTLMEFTSVVDAVRFAVDVQRLMAERNAGVPEDRRISYRFGINIGDIIVEGDDIFGDGVNVAARLEALAQPGGVCVSRTVFNHVKAKVDLAFEDLGEQQVKNIPEPVQVFQVLLDAPAAPRGTVAAATAKRPLRWPVVAGGLIVLVIVAGIALWQRPWEPREEPASEASMAFPLPDKPSIAVLPFSNISDDASQEYFADGMTEDLITDLSKISGLFVIARNSSFSYKGQQVKVRQVAEELGVRYVLEGSVRRAGDEVRINAQLIDATTGGHLWAERYDGRFADVFDLQDRVTNSIVNALALELTPQEMQRMEGLGTENAEAHDAYLLGLSFYYRRTPESFAKARAQFERAIELDPQYSAAYAVLGKIFAQVEDISYSRALEINFRDAVPKARAALDKVSRHASTDFHVVRSWLALNRHQHERAILEAERALEISPNDVDALEALARAQIYAGRPKSGIELAERVKRQNPSLPARSFMLIGLAEFALGHPDKAVEHIQRAFDLGSEEISYAGVLAAAHGLLNEIAPAQSALKIFRQGFPGSPDLSRSIEPFPFSDLEVLQRLAEGLEIAGMKVWYSRNDGGYLPLHSLNKLSGPDIRSVFAGGRVEGKRFWYTDRWQRLGNAVGAVEYRGSLVQVGAPRNVVGTSRVDDDMLCERWPGWSDQLELCSIIYRVPDGNARTRWGDYVIVTDDGPHPFRLVD